MSRPSAVVIRSLTKAFAAVAVKAFRHFYLRTSDSGALLRGLVKFTPM
jgi:hypothetical protein